MTRSEFRIERALWPDQRDALGAVRHTVFIREQNVPEELEWDGLDGGAFHFIARDGHGEPVGVLRMLPDGHIGRVAVLAPWRGRGVGTALMHAALSLADERGLSPHLDAQVEAIPFYERLGFVAHGAPFMDAGIPHRHMTRVR